jgi:hypothetical protein
MRRLRAAILQIDAPDQSKHSSQESKWLRAFGDDVAEVGHGSSRSYYQSQDVFTSVGIKDIPFMDTIYYESNRNLSPFSRRAMPKLSQMHARHLTTSLKVLRL